MSDSRAELATKLLEKRESNIALEKASASELWDEVSVLEDKLENLEDEIEKLEDEVFGLALNGEETEESQETYTVESARAFYENAPIVAASKGLPQLDGRLIKMFWGAGICREQLYSADRTIKSDVSKARSKFPRKSEDYRPDEVQLAKINSFSNIDLKTDDVYCYPVKMADQLKDRGSDMQMPKALASGARMMPDMPIQIDHDHSAYNSLGKIYEACVRNKCLMGMFYVLDQPEYKSINDRIQAGIMNKVSVCFGMDPKDYVCSSCLKSLYDMACRHFPGMIDEKGNEVLGLVKDWADAYETSLVAIPCLPAAGIRRQEAPTTEVIENSNKSMTDVGKIPNDKELMKGDLSVVDTAPNPVVTPADVKSPVVEKAAEAAPTETAPVVETPTTPEAPKVDPIEVAAKALTDVATKLAEMIDAQAKASANTNEVLKALVEANNKQSALISKAMRIADENPATEKAAKLVETKVAPETVDFNDPGVMANAITKAFCPDFGK